MIHKRVVQITALVLGLVGVGAGVGHAARRPVAEIRLSAGAPLASFEVMLERMGAAGPWVTVAVSGLNDRWLDPGRRPTSPDGAEVREIEFFGWREGRVARIEVIAREQGASGSRAEQVGVYSVRIGRSLELKDLAKWGVKPMVVRVAGASSQRRTPN